MMDLEEHSVLSKAHHSLQIVELPLPPTLPLPLPPTLPLPATQLLLLPATLPLLQPQVTHNPVIQSQATAKKLKLLITAQ